MRKSGVNLSGDCAYGDYGNSSKPAITQTCRFGACRKNYEECYFTHHEAATGQEDNGCG